MRAKLNMYKQNDERFVTLHSKYRTLTPHLKRQLYGAAMLMIQGKSESGTLLTLLQHLYLFFEDTAEASAQRLVDIQERFLTPLISWGLIGQRKEE